MNESLNSIEEAITSIARGEVVLVLDAEDRENEGDFICAAEKATPETINFMLDARGQLCVSVMPETAQRYGLAPLVNNNTAPLATAFLTPIDHCTCKTGITAAERSLTIRQLVDPSSTKDDFVRPGHVFPLLANPAGVLGRPGHTEAAADLARLAGFSAAGVLVEVLDQDGSRPSRPKLQQLARQHGLCIITIEQLIDYRRSTETLIRRAAETQIPTKYGPMKVIAYDVEQDEQKPIALVMGDVEHAAAPLVRMHSSCFTGDLIASLRCDYGDQLQQAQAMIGRDGVGAIVYLPQEGRGIGLVDKLRAYALQEQGLDTVEASEALGFRPDHRDYHVGLQILEDLGITRLRLLTNNPKKVEAIQTADRKLTLIDQVPILPPINEHNERYLNCKQQRMGHEIPTIA